MTAPPVRDSAAPIRSFFDCAISASCLHPLELQLLHAHTSLLIDPRHGSRRTAFRHDHSMSSSARVHAFTNDALADHDATALAELVRAGQLSAAEVTEAAVRRARAVDPRITAVEVDDYDGAVRAAGTLPEGVLHGVPTFVKDNVDVARAADQPRHRRLRRPAGGRGQRVHHPAALARRERARQEPPARVRFQRHHRVPRGRPGAQPVGPGVLRGRLVGWLGGAGGRRASCRSRTRTTAAARSASRPRPAGSSASSRPEAAWSATSSTSSSRCGSPPKGVVTRTVRDTAAFFAGAEQHWRNPHLPPVRHVTGPGSTRLRVGLVLDSVTGNPTDAETRSAVLDTVRLLEDLGHHVEEAPMPVSSRFAQDFALYWGLLGLLVTSTGTRVMSPDFDVVPHRQPHPRAGGQVPPRARPYAGDAGAAAPHHVDLPQGLPPLRRAALPCARPHHARRSASSPPRWSSRSSSPGCRPTSGSPR